MKIDIEKNTIIFTPETNDEIAKLDAIWKLTVDCNGVAKKLSPIGEFIPNKNAKGASFYIEGLEGKDQGYIPIYVFEDCKVYCRTCNKILDLKNGNSIPICCGKTMEIVD